MRSDPKALVITGFGLNCEDETVYALRRVGALVCGIHLNDLLKEPHLLREHQILILIGGFSFGDHIAAGRVFAARLRHRLKEPLRDFILSGNLVMGICNGFQTMVKLGILPALGSDLFEQEVSLIHNDSGVFRNDWVHLSVDPQSPCVFTRGMKHIELPIRHGEGKFVPRDQEQLKEILEQRLVALRYVDPKTGEPTLTHPHNPNGSIAGIAGICSPSGRLFGLMPHPEAYHSAYNHPQWQRRRRDLKTSLEGEGLLFFQNAVEFVKDAL